MPMTWQEAQEDAIGTLMEALIELSLNGDNLAAAAKADLEEVINDAKTDLNQLGGEDVDSDVPGSLETSISTRKTEVSNIKSGKLKDGALILTQEG